MLEPRTQSKGQIKYSGPGRSLFEIAIRIKITSTILAKSKIKSRFPYFQPQKCTYGWRIWINSHNLIWYKFLDAKINFKFSILLHNFRWIPTFSQFSVRSFSRVLKSNKKKFYEQKFSNRFLPTQLF